MRLRHERQWLPPCSRCTERRLPITLKSPTGKVTAPFATTLQPPYKVDLTRPEKTLIVQLIKSCAAVSVVSGYWQLQKFNIRELCMSDEERAAKEGDKEVCKKGGGLYVCMSFCITSGFTE